VARTSGERAAVEKALAELKGAASGPVRDQERPVDRASS